MKGLDDGPDGLNDAAWERALGGAGRKRAAPKIDLNQLIKLPRFEFIAAYLVMLTRKAANRAHVHGYQVTHRAGKWSVIQTRVAGGTVVYSTDDACKLFDYVHRGPLGYFTREADNLRVANEGPR